MPYPSPTSMVRPACSRITQDRIAAPSAGPTATGNNRWTLPSERAVAVPSRISRASTPRTRPRATSRSGWLSAAIPAASHRTRRDARNTAACRTSNAGEAARHAQSHTRQSLDIPEPPKCSARLSADRGGALRQRRNEWSVRFRGRLAWYPGAFAVAEPASMTCLDCPSSVSEASARWRLFPQASLAAVFVVAAQPHLGRVSFVAAERGAVEEAVVDHHELQAAGG